MAFAFAINIGDILYLWLTGIGMASVVLVPGYFLGWFSKKASSDGVLLGMAAGIVYVTLMGFGVIEDAPLQVCCGMLLNFIISLTVGRIEGQIPMFKKFQDKY